MKDDCIFCKIISGDIPSYTLYEDEETKVFLDAFPVSRGHALLVPKKHYETLYDIPEEELSFIKKLPMIAKKIKEITGASGINIWQNNGKDAGQLVPHVHFHIVPRFPNDNLIKFPSQHKLLEEDALSIIEKFKSIEA